MTGEVSPAGSGGAGGSGTALNVYGPAGAVGPAPQEPALGRGAGDERAGGVDEVVVAVAVRVRLGRGGGEHGARPGDRGSGGARCAGAAERAAQEAHPALARGQRQVLGAVAVEVAADGVVGPFVAVPGALGDPQDDRPAGEPGRAAEEQLQRDGRAAGAVVRGVRGDDQVAEAVLVQVARGDGVEGGGRGAGDGCAVGPRGQELPYGRRDGAPGSGGGSGTGGGAVHDADARVVVVARAGSFDQVVEYEVAVAVAVEVLRYAAAVAVRHRDRPGCGLAGEGLRRGGAGGGGAVGCGPGRAGGPAAGQRRQQQRGRARQRGVAQ
ncbi:hypothetical protein [Streptomyces wuyuanensis]|uniref:hypothetical protein n=1 Tax=Streptomyces wuyuanensis TaxID=1196353 RepID=UPI00344648B2